jgi:DNA-binding transcriptional ArsR family regulator
MKRRKAPELKLPLDHAAKFLGALAHKKRLIILNAALHEELSVTDLVELTELSPSSLAQHLTKLTAEKLLSTRRSGHKNLYRVSSHRIEPVLDVLSVLYPSTPLKSLSSAPLHV